MTGRAMRADAAMQEAVRVSAALGDAVTARRGGDSRLTDLFGQLARAMQRLKSRAESAETEAAEAQERASRAEARAAELDACLGVIAAERDTLLRSFSVLTAAVDDACARLSANDAAIVAAMSEAEAGLGLEIFVETAPRDFRSGTALTQDAVATTNEEAAGFAEEVVHDWSGARFGNDVDDADIGNPVA